MFPDGTVPEIRLAPMKRCYVAHEIRGKRQLPRPATRHKACACKTNSFKYVIGRTWLIDSGAFSHFIGRGSLTADELSRVYKIPPYHMNTARGMDVVDEALDVDVPGFGKQKCLILNYESDMCLLSPGMLISDALCDFHWTREDGPWLETNDESIPLNNLLDVPSLDEKDFKVSAKGYYSFFGRSPNKSKVAARKKAEHVGTPESPANGKESVEGSSPTGCKEDSGAVQAKGDSSVF